MNSHDFFTRCMLSNRRWSSAVAHTRNWLRLWERRQLSMTPRSQATKTTRFKRINEPRHDNTNKVSVRPAKTQISLGIRPVWSESSLCAQWVAKDPRFLHADSENSDQTGRMPRLIWVFTGHTLTLLVLSWGGSHLKKYRNKWLWNMWTVSIPFDSQLRFLENYWLCIRKVFWLG